MSDAVSLPEKIQHWADTQPDALAFSYLANGEQQTSSLTYGQLYASAQRIAGAMTRRGVRHNDRVLLLLPQDLRFVTAVIGCFLSRAAVVPIKLPRPGGAPAQLLSILKSAAPRIILTTRELFERLQAHVTDGIKGLVWEMYETLESEEAVPRLPPVERADLALVQYSSGSTGEPKGIAITHGNLLHNQECIRQAFGHSSDMVAGGWLPMHHDMGLIGLVLQPLYCGGRGVLMSPLAFLQRPLRWLRMISQHGITTSGGPNFAFDACVQHARDRDLVGVDLSRWRIAFNGAEPIRSDTIERFCDTFAAQGFQRRSMYPCYGLAESTLFVSGGSPGAGPITVTPPEEARQSPRYAVNHSAVSCGRAWNGTTIRIVDPDTAQLCPPGEVGEIWVSGPSVGAGYFQDPARTAEIFAACVDGAPDTRYLRTGDLGFLLDGELIVAGRSKDVVIIRGRNHYPQDLERTMGDSAPVLHRNGGVAFSVDRDREESLILIQELVRGASVTNAAQLVGLIRQNVIEEHGVAANTVMLVTAGVLPRTSSGKLRRSTCRELFLAGYFEQHSVCAPEETVPHVS
jgi:acyl-CoA synthetase (AMP-forming)/AMP-acid ligase II